MRAYQRIPFSNAQLEQSIVCNPTHIKQTLHHFISRNNARDATVHFALRGPRIVETITNKKSTIDSADYTSYLYTLDDKSFYYTVSINQALLMQYQLLTMEQYLHLATITTPFIAHLKLYQNMQGTLFAHTQLAHDLRLHNHRIEALFDDIDITTMIDIAKNVSIDVVKEFSFLVSSLGLLYLRR